MSNYIAMLRHAVLRHAPQRHGVMQPPTSTDKYREYRRALTDAQLTHHLAGSVTLAAPTTTADRAVCMVFDIDGDRMAGDGLATITALLATAGRRGWWAWGEWHHQTDRGYVWVPFDRLVSAEQLKQAADALATAAELTPQQRAELENRTAKRAITRLPFGRHTHTGQRGEIIFQDGTSAALDDNAEAALALWAARYRDNPAEQIPPAVTVLAPPQHRNQPKPPAGRVSAAEVQQRYNDAHDVCDILATAGGRRHARTSWRCPCGHHQHNDREASLLITPARSAKYGAFVVQGYAPSCVFHHETQVFDAFNVYRLLHGLSNADMLQHARRELGLDAPERPQRAATTPAAPSTHHERRRPAQEAAGAPPAAPSDPDIAQRTILRAALDPSLTPATRRVFAALLTILDNRPVGRVSLEALIAESGHARRTVQIALNILAEARYITIEKTQNTHGGDSYNRYRIGGPGGRAAVPNRGDLHASASITSQAPPHSEGGGRSGGSPLKLNAWKGGQPGDAPAAPPATMGLNPARPENVQRTSVRAATGATPAAPEADGQAEGARFDPAVYEAFAAQGRGYSGVAYTKSQQQLERAYALDHPPTTRPTPPPAPAAPAAAQITLSGPGEGRAQEGGRGTNYRNYYSDYNNTGAAPAEGASDYGELAILRDIVRSLQKAAIQAKTDRAAWARYHRERERLAAIERQVARRQAAAPRPDGPGRTAPRTPSKGRLPPLPCPAQVPLGLGG